MATIVRALWLDAERARFPCNDWPLWKSFSARRLIWVMSKIYEREGENNKNYRQNITIYSITERNILAYRYFFSMSDEESHSARKRMLKITSGVFYCIHIINNLLTSSVRSLQGNPRPRPWCLTSQSLGQYIKTSVWDFPVMTSLWVNKWYIIEEMLSECCRTCTMRHNGILGTM